MSDERTQTGQSDHMIQLQKVNVSSAISFAASVALPLWRNAIEATTRTAY